MTAYAESARAIGHLTIFGLPAAAVIVGVSPTTGNQWVSLDMQQGGLGIHGPWAETSAALRRLADDIDQQAAERERPKTDGAAA